MNPKTKRIIAVIALVFAGIFTLAFPFYLALRQNESWGWLMYVVIISGVIGAVMWFIVFLEQRKEKNDERGREEMDLRTKIAEKELEQRVSSGEIPEEKDVTDDLTEE